MTTITIDLAEDELLRLGEMASRLGLVPEDLVRLSIEELLARPEADFEHAVDYILESNAELYERLA